MAAPQGIRPAVTPALRAVLITSPGATAAEIHGQPANPAHGQFTWEQPQWMPWQIYPGVDGPAAHVNDALLAERPPNAPVEADPYGYADSTATGSHGAPWPRAVNPDAQWDPQAAAAQQQINAAAHEHDSGDPAAFTTWPPPTSHQVGWERMGYVTDGESGMDQVPPQLQGLGNTGFRRDTGWFVPGEDANRYGLSGSHVTRYRATGDIPVPPNTTHGAQRPLRIQPASARAYPVGEGSPFEGQLPGWYGPEGMYGDYVGVPSDYQASPDPVTNPPLPRSQQDAGPVWGAEGIW
jgi:hypothetical protein